ncbi:MAG: helix-turn-helix domain-containing protein [Actinobacteria bacterium]|uniref:Unannotated protein n=1 Tax=freshwater metagenome TaxID=449393 RepID=A0A6J6WQQ1_9ZZZZ|nr:helix-turn-helix domain-containing protein [Actinomycetota bacterium]
MVCYIRFMATIPLPSQVLSKRLAEMRGACGMHQQGLADEMTKLGWSWVRSTVAKIEAGTRQVSVDELVSLAYVLGVTPVALITTQIPTEMRLMPSVPPVSSDRVWQWSVGLNDFFDPQEEVEEEILMHPSSYGHADIDHEAREKRVMMYRWQRPTYISDADDVLPGLSGLARQIAKLQLLAASGGPPDVFKISDQVELMGDTIDHLRSVVQHLRFQEDQASYEDLMAQIDALKVLIAREEMKATK